MSIAPTLQMFTSIIQQIVIQTSVDKDYILISSYNKTKDWALVQNAALVINLEVMELG